MAALLVVSGSSAGLLAPATALALDETPTGRTLYVADGTTSSEVAGCASPDYLRGDYDGGDGSGNEAIQAALNAATSGDTVHVCAGTYRIDASLGSNRSAVRLVGDASTATILDGAGATQLIVFGGDVIEASLSALTLTNGLSASGGALSAFGGSTTVALADVRLIDNTAILGYGGSGLSGEGGALRVDGTLSLTRVYASGNHADAGGVAYFGALTAVDSTLEENGALASGGVFLGQRGVVSGSTFTDNTARTNGGAIYTYGDLTVGTSIFSANEADFGGAIVAHAVGSSDSTYRDNTAGQTGGAIFTGSVTSDGDTFEANQSANGSGGALAATTDLEAGRVVIAGGTFTDNASRNSPGGAVYAQGDVTVAGSSRSTFSRNAASQTAGGFGGAIYADGSVMVDGADFTANSAASNGGAIRASGNVSVTDATFTANRTLDDDGGAIWVNGDWRSERSTYVDNIAGVYGGAVATPNGTMSSLGDTFLRNVSFASGGALYATSTMTLTLGTFTENSATMSGGAVFAAGTATVTILGSTFGRNHSAQDGGALFGYGDVTSGSSTYSQNVASTSGGGAISILGSLTSLGDTFTSNAASGYGGAILAIGAASLTDATVSDNVASEGGALVAYRDATVAGGTFLRNRATAGYGGAISVGGNVTASDATFDDNSSTSQGGAIRAEGDVTVTRTGADGNQAVFGGAIFGYTSVHATDADFSGNTTVGSGDPVGGAAIASYGPISIAGGTFRSNEASKWGGAVLSWSSSVEVTGATFSLNHSWVDGGAIRAVDVSVVESAFDGNWASSYGGGAIAATNSISVTDATFTANRSMGFNGEGGALDAASVTVERSTFRANSTTIAAAAIFSDGDVRVADSTFTENTAGSAFYPSAYGSAIVAADVVVSGSTFARNRAFGDGGPIKATGSVEVENATFVANDTKRGGAVTAAGPVTLTHVTFLDNAVMTRRQASNVTTGDTLTATATIFSGGTCAAGSIVASDDLATDGSCPGTVVAAADLRLRDLADDLGPTQTVALLPGSVALDAIPGPCAVSIDQRGVARPQGAGCDIGAFERRATELALSLSSGDDDDTITYGTPLTITVGATPATSGDVVLRDGAGATVGTCSLDPVAGSCSVSLGVLHAGSYTYRASAGGNPDFDPWAAELTVEVLPAPTSITLAGGGTSTVGSNVTFTATLSPASAGGTVSFSDGTTGTIMGCGAATITAGVATCTTSSLPVGSYAIGAVYLGDGDHESTAATTAHVVTAAPTGGGGAPSGGAAAQTISFTLPAYAYGGSRPRSIALDATASSGLAVTYAVSTPASCRITGTVLTPLAAGTCTVTASQEGSATFAAASVTRSTTVIVTAIRVTLAQSFSVNGEVRLSVPLVVPRGTRVVMGAKSTEPQMAGKTIEIWAKYGATGRWQRIGTRTMSSLLTASYAFLARPDATYRWRWGGNGVLHDQWSGYRRVLGR